MSNKDYIERLGDRVLFPEFKHLMRVLIPEYLSYCPGGILYDETLPMERRVDYWFEALERLMEATIKVGLNPQCYPTPRQLTKNMQLSAVFHSKGANRNKFHKYWLQRLELLGWRPDRKLRRYKKDTPKTREWEFHLEAFHQAVNLRYGPVDDREWRDDCCD